MNSGSGANFDKVDRKNTKTLENGFINALQKTFCVYSANSGLLLGDYIINSTMNDKTGLKVLPKICSQSQFPGIDQCAIKKTNIQIQPGWQYDMDSALAMVLVIKSQGVTKQVLPVPLARGLAIANHKLKGKHFFPVIQQMALQAFSWSAPSLPLCWINMNQLKQSQPEQTRIKQLICERLRYVVPENILKELYATP